MLLSFIRVAWENANILFQILFHTSNFSENEILNSIQSISVQL